MRTCLLGIDIGTSACKIAVFDENGNVLAAGNGDYNVYYPQPGWAEQDAREWWSAICDTIPKVLEKGNIRPEEIAGIGIDGQSWSAIAVDEEGEVLCRTPIWMDTRAQDICDEMNEKIGADNILALCGNPLQPSYTTPKILWYQRNMPEVYAKTTKILQSNSYIAYMLTGQMSQDLSQGYGLHCFNMAKGTWDSAMAAEFGFSTDLLPEIYPCHAIVGKVTKEAAAQCGLVEGIPVAAGGLDAKAAYDKYVGSSGTLSSTMPTGSFSPSDALKTGLASAGFTQATGRTEYQGNALTAQQMAANAYATDGKQAALGMVRDMFSSGAIDFPTYTQLFMMYNSK